MLDLLEVSSKSEGGCWVSLFLRAFNFLIEKFPDLKNRALAPYNENRRTVITHITDHSAFKLLLQTFKLLFRQNLVFALLSFAYRDVKIDKNVYLCMMTLFLLVIFISKTFI